MNDYYRWILLAVILFVFIGSPLAALDTDDLQPGLAMNLLRLPLAILAETDRSADKLGEIEAYALVEVLQVDNPWAEVAYNELVGWIHYAPLGSPLLINLNGPTPPPRGYHYSAYDVESDRVILFGGQSPGSATKFNDTWTFESITNSWTRMNPSQSPPAATGALAYDSQSDRAIFFMGTDFPPTTTASETWAYDFNADTWTHMAPSPAPPPLLGPDMVYDFESDRIILFGGSDPKSIGSGEEFANETWVYDYDSNSWTNMDPVVSPPGMNYYPVAYSTVADRVILIPMAYGRLDDETWAYDYNTNTWEVFEMVEGRPGQRDYSAMVYVPGIDRLVLFGNGEPVSRDDMWSYDFSTNTWTELEPAERPSQRGWHRMVYSDADDRIILFGGGANRGEFTLETWVYDPNANTWTQVGP